GTATTGHSTTATAASRTTDAASAARAAGGLTNASSTHPSNRASGAADGLAGLVPPLVSTGEPGGWEISPLTLDVLSCEAGVVPVLTDSFGRALDVGDTQYPFPPRIRRAIEVRDLHCTFPGCSAKPAWCHVHHLVAFGRGGPTSEGNGALLCGRHHRYVHAHGWTGTIV